MKVALLLTGHARTYNVSYEGIKNCLLDQHDVDVYISTWSVDNWGRVKGTADWVEPMPLNIQNVIDLYQPYKIHVEDHFKFYSNRFPIIDIVSSTRPDDIFKVNPFAIECGTFFVERMRDQWYMVKQGWQIIENPEQYDVIIRLRFDLYLDNINLDLGKSNIVIPDRKVEGWERGSVCDLMAYGPPTQMKKYCKLFDSIEPMYVNDNGPIHHADEMLGFYLRKYCGINPTLADVQFHFSVYHNK
jgi:hypothetical protein